MLEACFGLVRDDCTCYSCWGMGLYSMLVACFGLVHDDCTCRRCWYMGIVHQMHNCMSQVWVHCDGISCTIACYGIGTIILIVIVNMEYHSIAFIVWDSVEFSYGSILLNLFLLVSAEYSVLETCIGTWTFDWELGLETWILDWDSHICRIGHAFTTVKLWLNNVLYYQSFIVISILI